MKALKNWYFNEDGATAIEYCLLGAGVALAIAAIVFTMGADTRDHLFTPVAAIFK